MSARFVPVPTPETGTYWEKAAEGELWLPRCDSCGRAVFYPRSFCPHCHGEVTTANTRSVPGPGSRPAPEPARPMTSA